MLVDEVARTIFVKTSETFRPGILVKTVEAVRYLLKDASRHYKYILRTNMSSMWHWQRLLAYLETMETSETKTYPVEIGKPWVASVLREDKVNLTATCCSGTGILMNRPAARILADQSNELRYEMIDDLAMGQLWSQTAVEMIPLPRTDFTDHKFRAPLDTNHDSFFWRVKNPQDRLLYDGYILSRLYIELYGTAPPREI